MWLKVCVTKRVRSLYIVEAFFYIRREKHCQSTDDLLAECERVISCQVVICEWVVGNLDDDSFYLSMQESDSNNAAYEESRHGLRMVGIQNTCQAIIKKMFCIAVRMMIEKFTSLPDLMVGDLGRPVIDLLSLILTVLYLACTCWDRISD